MSKYSIYFDKYTLAQRIINLSTDVLSFIFFPSNQRRCGLKIVFTEILDEMIYLFFAKQLLPN